MKKICLMLLSVACMSVSFAQSPTFKKDASDIAHAIKHKCLSGGYKLLINYNTTATASFYVKPGTNYLLYYIYDILPKKVVNFDAHLMTADSAMQRKYTNAPEDILVKGSAKVALLDFKTPAFEKTRLPVKVNANPKAIIYVYYK